NKVKARRRDIVDLFLDTGVGANLYSFIAQGQVDRIVSQSANERRSLIDEAAGISRYKVRRDEAIVRLQATGAQLDRAADVADEMGRRLATLSRQVIKAGRFRRLRAKIRQREIVLGVVKYAALADDRRALRERLRRLKDTTGALERSIERVERDLHTREEEVEAVRGAVSTWRDQSAELEARRREQEGAATLHRSRHDELQAEARRADGRRERAEERRGRAQKEIVGVGETLAETETALDAVDLEGAAAEHGRLRAEVETRRVQLEELAREAASVRARRQGLEEALARLGAPQEGALPEPVDREGPAAAVEEARSTVDAAEAAETVQQEAVRAAREAARAVQERARALLDEHARASRAWEEEQKRRERDRARRVAEAERAVAEAEEKAVRAHREARAAARQRLSTWTDVWRATHDRRRNAAVSEAATGRTAAREAAIRGVKALEQREHAEVEAAREGVDTASLDAARRRLDAATKAEAAAREALENARSTLAADRSRLAALEAEWKVLEEQRAASVPEAWRDLPLFDGTADADDARRAARPELLGLPVVEAGDLGATTGRGVLAGATGRWTVVDDLKAALAVLAAQGPPVASRDGAIRVDADGVVELGWTRGSRWAEVRVAREEAALALEVAQGRAEETLQAHRAALAGVAEARTTLAAEERAHREAVQVAEKAARARHAEAVAQVRRDAEQQETAIQKQLDARLAALESDRVTHERLEREAREAVEQLQRPPSSEVAARRAELAGIPPLETGERPERPELPEVDPRELADAEACLDAARAEVRRARNALAVAEEARTRAEARHQAREAEIARRGQAARQREDERSALQARLDALVDVEGEEAAREAHTAAAAEAEAARRALAEAQERRSALRETLAGLRTRAEALHADVQRATSDLELAVEERTLSERQAIEALEASRMSQEAAERLAVERAEVVRRLTVERDRLGKLLQEVTKVREPLDRHRAELQTSEAERVEVDARVTQLQLDIEGLRKRLGDRYQVSLPGLLDRLSLRRELVMDVDPAVATTLVVGETVLEAVEELEISASLLDDEDRVVAMVQELEVLRNEVQGIGEVNLAAEGEYVELKDRWEELDRQRDDLDASVKSIRAAIAKMNRTCRERFRDAYDRVNEAFQEAYPQLVGGGDARLALTDEEDLLETGVDIFVRPPGKRLQNLTLLSGGEKAMTAIALLLAIFRVRPSPFCVLDEVDAPLDEANGHRFNNMIREMSGLSQFIVITHNRTTMECADVLYGVTMANPGVSTLVSVALDRP
ncbi:MAG: hypothetical protein KC656_07490, partial [Myxococcales bacterium]|nr:hypothetical protein [Myxococcales bacterium]